jgi:hypothetical protein
MWLMKKITDLTDVPTLIVILLTLILFAVSLFVKGLSHDLLLEAGVFLVSTKLILMVFHNRKSSEKLTKDLNEIKEMLMEIKNKK